MGVLATPSTSPRYLYTCSTLHRCPAYLQHMGTPVLTPASDCLFSRTVGSCQVGGAKLTDTKDIDRLQESLEKIVGTSSRSLQRTASKRPHVGDVSQTGNKSLLYNLMGMHTAAAHTWSLPGSVSDVLHAVALR